VARLTADPANCRLCRLHPRRPVTDEFTAVRQS